MNEFQHNGFGVCPKCGKHDGYYNVGKSHWFYCEEHKTKWCSAWGLFTVDETPDEQERYYNEMGFGQYQHIEPPCYPDA